MNNFAPESEVAVRIGRGNQTIDAKLSAVGLPTSVPTELPPALEASTATNEADEFTIKADNGDAKSKGESRDVRLPEFPQQCKLYVPAGHEAGRPQGLLLWLHDGDAASADKVVDQWQAICDRDGLLLAVPAAAEANRWDRTELEYLGRLVARLINQYKVDPRRVVIFGRGSGGPIAWSLGFSGRGVIRGIAVSAAPLPRRMTVPANEPNQRLAIFAATSSAKDASIPTAQGLQKCADAGYPVSTVALESNNGELADQVREELARWIDTLDRF
jgi:poly(3-hydroxybutyrate) depolymerase